MGKDVRGAAGTVARRVIPVDAGAAVVDFAHPVQGRPLGAVEARSGSKEKLAHGVGYAAVVGALGLHAGLDDVEPRQTGLDGPPPERGKHVHARLP